MGYTATYPAVYPADTATGAFEIDVSAPAPAPPKGPWRFLLGPAQPAGGATSEIVQAQNKTVTLRTEADQNSEVSLDIDGRSLAASGVMELETDLTVMFGSQIIQVFRVAPTQDTLTASAHRTTVTAYDYREVLRRRAVLPGDTLSWTDTDQATIAWNMIQATQGRPGGNLGITRGVGASTGVKRTFTASLGDYAGDDITTLAQLDNGFEWQVTPYGMADLRLDVFYPRQGTNRGVVLAYGDARISSITRAVDPSAFADSVYVTGNTLTGSTTVESGSNGGTISSIATWSSPSPGVLDVADSSGFVTPGLIKVHASGKTNAVLSYTGISAGGRFTGCQYISGSPSGTVATGNSVDIVPLTPQQLEAANIGTRAEQRWDSVVGTQDNTQATLNDHAQGLLNQLQVVVPSYTIQFYPGAWGGPDWLWLGDTVTVRINSGRLQVNDSGLRVVEMNFAVSPDGVETLTLTVGAIPFKLHKKIASILKRLRYLESR